MFWLPNRLDPQDWPLRRAIQHSHGHLSEPPRQTRSSRKLDDSVKLFARRHTSMQILTDALSNHTNASRHDICSRSSYEIMLWQLSQLKPKPLPLRRFKVRLKACTISAARWAFHGGVVSNHWTTCCMEPESCYGCTWLISAFVYVRFHYSNHTERRYRTRNDLFFINNLSRYEICFMDFMCVFRTVADTDQKIVGVLCSTCWAS